MHVLIPRLCETGYVRIPEGRPLLATVDVAEVDNFELEEGEYITLTWHKWKSSPRQTSLYIYRMKAWVRFGQRKVTIYARRIRDDNSLGPERRILRRINGKDC